MNNIPVDVDAIFNTQGKIKPRYIRIEDKDHLLHTYKIEDVEYDKDEQFAGIHAILFVCHIQVSDQLQQIRIKYHINTHQWVLVDPGH